MSDNYYDIMYVKACKYASILAKTGMVDSVFLTGSMCHKTCTHTSDIDLFIITKPHRLYIVRVLFNLYLSLKNELSKPHNHIQKICPNHYITSKTLILEERTDFIYNEMNAMIPLYDMHNMKSKLLYINGFSIDKHIHTPIKTCKYSVMSIINTILYHIHRYYFSKKTLPIHHGLRVLEDELRLHRGI